ncbi:hypothetical protein PT974_02846 [Cladobotryum mycophilum]|uniref:Gfd2/YDR514C-like C-terminal domain-containing protein n=1 Tax=Cladobotryum mycophilum TaxID=491253 RepID=A0ABR0T0F3_9HYPO
MDSPPFATKPTKLKPRLGGLKNLERLLGLRQDQILPTDAIFISLDLEVASDRKTLHLSAGKPVVTQLGFATLDTRDIRALSSLSDMRGFISIRMFKVAGLSSSKTAQSKGKKRCVFVKPRHITQEQVPTTLTQNLRIHDGSSKDGPLRNIVLVGHSIREDLKIIRLLDINIFDVAPVLTAINTYVIARYILPPYSPNICLQPEQNFSLAGVLSELGCQPDPSEFHNADNDAVYSLYMMLLLAIKQGTSRNAELTIDELRNLETLKWVVFKTLESGVSTTSFNRHNHNYKSTITLGAGIREIGVIAQFSRLKR